MNDMFVYFEFSEKYTCFSRNVLDHKVAQSLKLGI